MRSRETFKRGAPGTIPDWLRHIWAVREAAAKAGTVDPFDGTPELADAEGGGWTERYPNGGMVEGGRRTVIVSYPVQEGVSG